MSKHYTKRERWIDIEFRLANRSTAHGGQFGINELAHAFGLRERVKKEPRLDPHIKRGKVAGGYRRALRPLQRQLQYVDRSAGA